MAGQLGVAASGSAEVSQTAVEILKAGGNAFDAALGALCTASIAEPLLVSLGGGGFLLARSAHLRHKVFELKREQIDATGADSLVLSCGSCRMNFETGKMKSGWQKPIESLVEMVGENLAE